MILEVSFPLIYNVYTTGITYDDHQVTIIICLWYKPQERCQIFYNYKIAKAFSYCKKWHITGLYYKTYYGRNLGIFVIS
jgi:hypothetical protein